MGKRIVIALGGNALGSTPYEQLSLVTETAKPIVDLIAQGNEVVIAHGNGPKVGMINLGLDTAAAAGALPRVRRHEPGLHWLPPAERHRQ